MNFLHRLFYSPSAIRAVRALHLSRVLREWYYRWARPSNGILQLSVGNISAQFYVQTPAELRLLESAGGAGGEERILGVLISTLRPGDVVFDVGANVGLYSVLLARAVGPRGRVISFEPQAQTYDHLQRNVNLNGLENVRCYRKALGDGSRQAKLYSSDIIGGSRLVDSDAGRGSAELVEIVQGDDLVEVEHLSAPRVVKIDVEGCEYSVIRGLRQTLAKAECEVVCCEIHPTLLPPQVRADHVLDLLMSLGFRHIDTYPRWDNTSHIVGYKKEAR